MMIGAGDLGVRVATSLMTREKIDELTLVDLPNGDGPKAAEYMSCCFPVPIHFEGINCMDTSAVETVLLKHKPDIIVFCASLRSSDTVMRTTDPRGKAMWNAGMGVQLAFQLPILISVMRAVKNVVPDTLVANFTIPDTCHKILHSGNLAPTIGLGNPGIMQMRIKANLVRSGIAPADVPLVRIISGFTHNVPVIFGVDPGDKSKDPMVFLGDDGTRATNDIMYMGEDLFNVLPMNYATNLSSLLVIEALLPGGPECRTSSPGAFGLFGGYPVKIVDQKMELDLPAEVTLEEAIEFNKATMPDTGIDRIDDDGTVYYSQKAIDLMADVEPRLTEPYNALTDTTRTKLVLDLMNNFKG